MTGLTLSNYQLGDLIGRGASGSVYRALNFLTGETVAIKSISLLSLAPSSLPDIMSEIDLLKNLNHANIVKYKGFVQDKESLHIILEYCENGSLQSILKKFGKFPESLVAVYISQVLEGLIYLHEQGVIHRDIKGANILTNKDGSVKLADFGVSSRTATPTLAQNENEVVGSPYWMAPEVIEQSGASTASDIWSVGCVVVELLEGKPPHGDLAPMQALWRIVQDESMRIPEGASPIVKDFLYHCFQKDPNLRVTAKKLLKHPWMVTTRKNLESAQASPPPPSRTSSGKRIPQAPAKNIREGQSTSLGTGKETIKAKKPITVYDEAVLRVQEWNQALNASPKAYGSLRRLPQSAATRKPSASQPVRARAESKVNPLGIFALPPLPSRESADSLEAEPSNSANPSPAQGIMQKNLHVSDVLSRAKERETQGESWDDDFASDVTFSGVHNRKEDSKGEEVNQKTLRPTKSPACAPSALPVSGSLDKLAKPASRTTSTSNLEDYSDLGGDEDDVDLSAKFANLKVKKSAHRGILHPNDLRKLKTIVPSLSARSLSTPAKPSLPVLATTLKRSPTSLGLPQSPRPPSRSPPTSRQNSLRNKAEFSESQLELQKYTENDEEDYEDIFDKQATTGAQSTQSLQLTRRSNKSWLGEDEEENDPFAEIEDDFDGDDLEANVLRDKRATLCATVAKLIDDLNPQNSASVLTNSCDELLGLLGSSPEDMGLEAHFMSSHGLLAVLEMLESRLSRDVVVRLLKIVNAVVTVDVEALESFCLVGGVPVIIPYTSKKHSLETRLQASTFIQQLTRSALTLQMFISCGGLRVLVELLDEDYSVNKTLILSSLEGISSVFDLQSPTPRNDFCRMFVREGILDPLSTALLSILDDKDLMDEVQSSRAVNVLLLFCQVAQADGRVREAFATRSIIIRLLKACDHLPRKLLVTAIKAIKHLSTSPQLIEVLQNSNATESLVSLLGRNMKGSHSNEICSHIFQTIYSMTRLSKARQEEAASSGIIPLLKKVIQGKSPLKQFALPILCDLASAGKQSRRILWQNEGLSLYLHLLEDPYWRVSALDAILAWMQDDTARVEDVLLEKTASESIVKCFVQSSGVSFEGILDPLLKILRLSISVTTSISQPPLFRHLATTLARPLKAVTKLNLLRLTRVLYDNHPDTHSLSRYGVRDVVEKLAKQDEAVLVRELAKEILPGLSPSTGGVLASEVSTGEETGTRHRHASTSTSTISASGSNRDARLTGEGSRSMGPPPLPDRSRTPLPERSHSSQSHRSTQSVSIPHSASSAKFPSASSSTASPSSSFTSSRKTSGTAVATRRPPSASSASSSDGRRHRDDPPRTSTGSIPGSIPISASTSMPSPYSDRAPVSIIRSEHLPSTSRMSLQSGEGRTTDVMGEDKEKAERPKHRRQISRSQLKDMYWQTDENGRLMTVRTPSR